MFIAHRSPGEKARWEISSEASWSMLHSLRTVHDGVVVGITTVLVDRPRLSARTVFPEIRNDIRQPRPIVLDPDLRIADLEETLLLKNPIVVCCDGDTSTLQSRRRRVMDKLRRECQGGEVITCKRDAVSGKCDIIDALQQLQTRCHIRSVLVEGGAGIIQAFLEAQCAVPDRTEPVPLVDQVIVTVKPWYLGGYRVMKKQLPSKTPLVLQRPWIAQGSDDFIVYGQTAPIDGGQQ